MEERGLLTNSADDWLWGSHHGWYVTDSESPWRYIRLIWSLIREHPCCGLAI